MHVHQQVFYDRVMEHTDAEAVGEAVVAFNGVAVLAPRGRFDIEMHLGFLKLVGQAGTLLKITELTLSQASSLQQQVWI